VTDHLQRAAELSGCVRDDGSRRGPPFCSAHDEDGNPPWERCRWVPIAVALHAAENHGRAAALKETADAWQWSDWAGISRHVHGVSDRIRGAQFVSDWLRARAIEAAGAAGEPDH
jgi:hypothetical protein